MGRRNPDPVGFSLIELVVVVGLLGVMFAFILPATWRFMSSNQLAGASSTLASDVHRARSLASSERKTYEILFSPNSYSLVRLSPAATVVTRTLPPGISCAASDTATFYPWGLTDAITIRIKGKRDSSLVTIASNGSVTHD